MATSSVASAPIPTDQLVVEAIVGIARGMGKKTVAEFVTDQDMTDRLRRSGIDYAQGFHIGVPRPIVETFAQHSAPGLGVRAGHAAT